MINRDDLEECLYHLPEEFSSNDLVSAFKEYYPLEWRKWVEFYGRKTTTRAGAEASTRWLILRSLKSHCRALVEEADKRRWRKVPQPKISPVTGGTTTTQVLTP